MLLSFTPSFCGLFVQANINFSCVKEETTVNNLVTVFQTYSFKISECWENHTFFQNETWGKQEWCHSCTWMQNVWFLFILQLFLFNLQLDNVASFSCLGLLYILVPRNTWIRFWNRTLDVNIKDNKRNDDLC